MNHSATQLRLVRNRIQSEGVSAPTAGIGIDVWTVLIPLLTPNSRDDDRRFDCRRRASSRFPNKTSRRRRLRRPSLLPEDALGGTFRRRHRRLHVLAAGAVVGEHVDNDEVGDRGSGVLTPLAD